MFCPTPTPPPEPTTLPSCTAPPSLNENRRPVTQVALQAIISQRRTLPITHFHKPGELGQVVFLGWEPLERKLEGLYHTISEIEIYS